MAPENATENDGVPENGEQEEQEEEQEAEAEPGFLVFHGLVVHSHSAQILSVYESAVVVAETRSAGGRILALQPSVGRSDIPAILAGLGLPSDLPIITLEEGSQLLMPGFVDTHNHAAQWAQRGLGQGMSLLSWLEEITFAEEARFADPAHARETYRRCVRGMLRQGVTAAAYYGSQHGGATRQLIDACLEAGQRAVVGKCNMDRGAPDWYREQDADESLRDTAECIAHAGRADPAGDLVRYAITPRFAISCTARLLRGLGDLAAAHPSLPIQTHFAEAAGEVRATLSLFPDFDNEADLYENFGLLTARTVLAHCTRMSPYEADRVREIGCGIAHCPTANMTVGGGFMVAPVTRWLRDGGIENIGLGTDIGGGYAPGILDAMRHAMIASYARSGLDRGEKGLGAEEDHHHPHRHHPNPPGLTLEEVVYMATLGGARVLGLGQTVGNLEEGKKFDAILVDMSSERGGVNTPVEVGRDTARTLLEKFVMTGDDRNVAAVFVNGRLVHGEIPQTAVTL